jgi:hypothetical protein
MADIVGAPRAPVEIQFRDRGQTSPRSAWLDAAIAAVAERSEQRTGTPPENR